MGINPSIPLAGRLPEIQGPMDLQKGALSVQYLINAAQLQKQQQAQNEISRQQQQIALQEQQQELKDRQAFNKAYMDAGGDWDKTIQNGTSGGVSATYLMKAQAARLDQLTKMATYNKDQLANETAKAEQLGKDASALLAIDDPRERQQAYIQMRNSHLLSGAYKASELPASMPSEQELLSYKAHSKFAMDAAKEAAELAEKNAKLPGEQAEAQQKRMATAAMQMSNAQNQIAWTAKRNWVAKTDPDIAAQIPENFSPEAAEEVRRMGIPPDKTATAEANVTEAKLAQRAAGGDKLAEAALKRLDQSKRESRPVVNIMTGNDVKDIADAIENGDQPPNLQGLYRNAGPVRAELARRGVPIAKMETDWKATQRYVSTLNGPQQTRLRQAISTANDSLDKIEGLYAEWQKLAPTSGFKLLNRGELIAAKNLPGRTGAVATALDAQIADLTSELGNVYMGGNSPTDHSLSLAAKNLSSDWNRETFEEGLKQARSNIKIRQNSIIHSAPAGLSGDTNYGGFNNAPASSGGPPAGATHKVKGPDGKMHYTNAQGTVDFGIVQ